MKTKCKYCKNRVEYNDSDILRRETSRTRGVFYNGIFVCGPEIEKYIICPHCGMRIEGVMDKSTRTFVRVLLTLAFVAILAMFITLVWLTTWLDEPSFDYTNKAETSEVEHAEEQETEQHKQGLSEYRCGWCGWKNHSKVSYWTNKDYFTDKEHANYGTALCYECNMKFRIPIR